jgi:hypothetical protein
LALWLGFFQALSLEAANEVDAADARRVNAAAGGNKVVRAAPG